jgi:hypothetical protein
MNISQRMQKALEGNSSLDIYQAIQKALEKVFGERVCVMSGTYKRFPDYVAILPHSALQKPSIRVNISWTDLCQDTEEYDFIASFTANGKDIRLAMTEATEPPTAWQIE